MWEDVLKTRSHWKLLNSMEQSFVDFCRSVGLIYELTYPYGLGDFHNGYNRNYNAQYEFLYDLVEQTLNDMARNGANVHEKAVNQPTPLGAEDFRHNVRLIVEDASFYLLFQCIRTEPVEAIIFHTEMNFRVPEKFWGHDTKIAEIENGIADILWGFVVSTNIFANRVIANLDIEEPPEGKEEDLNEWRGRVSSEATVTEGTERERWWE
jgi:hypothetical protein